MLLSLCLLGVIVGLLYLFVVWKNDHWKKAGVPYVEPKFFVGNIPNALTQKKHSVYDISEIFNKFRGQYQIAGFFSLVKPTLLVLDPAVVRQIFLTDFNKFNDNGFDAINKEIDPILGRNPFFLNGDEWKERRAEVTPAFTASRLRALYPIVESVCKDLTDLIDKEIRMGNPDGIDARELSAKYTTDVVSNCVFAMDSGALKDQDAIIRKMGKEMFKPSLRLMCIFVVSEILPFMNNILKMRLIPEKVENFFTNLMKDAAKQRRQSQVDHADVLQYLLSLQDKKNLSDVELVANAITFFLDGFETSSIAIKFILFELGRNPRVQEKLRKEILDAEAKAPLTMDSIAELPYLEDVIYEALRIHPPALILTKRALVDCELPLTQDGKKTFVVPKGTPITIPAWNIHRDPMNFKDPLTFYPERFEENGGLKKFKDNGTLLVFGMGPRICLGQRFAMTQVKAGIVTLLKNFEIGVNPKTQLPLVLEPKEFLNVAVGGIWLDFKRL